MSFTSDWLSLREPADAAARSRKLVRAMPGPYESIVDLGCGTGANLRWLAPQLGGRQHWTLIDHDEALLTHAQTKLRDWAASADVAVSERDGLLNLAHPSFACTVQFRMLDLSEGLGELDIGAGCLVTASALLDLVSERWLRELVTKVTRSRATVLWTLSYDGTIRVDPADPDDETIATLVNRHQRTDKGFGPALGPDAWLFARTHLEQEGSTVHVVDSAWMLQPDQRKLMLALIDGWAGAACEIAPDSTARIRHWQAERRRQAKRGELRITVGHRDLAAWPTDG